MQWNQCSPATFTLLTLDHLHLANTEARADCDCLPRDRNCIAVRTPFGGWFKVISPEVVIYQLRAGLHNESIYKGHLGLHASPPHNMMSFGSACSSPLSPTLNTEMVYEVGPRLRELMPRGQREPGCGMHATYGPPYSPSLY